MPKPAKGHSSRSYNSTQFHLPNLNDYYSVPEYDEVQLDHLAAILLSRLLGIKGAFLAYIFLSSFF